MKETGHHPSLDSHPANFHLRHIDGLRGVAVLLVLFFHLWIFSGNPQTARGGTDWWNPIAGGYVGVHLFLVISGFCVCWPYVNGKAMRMPEFFLRRALRLVPPYLVSLMLFTLASLAFGRAGVYWPENPGAQGTGLAKTFIIHALLIHNLFPNHILAINGAFWSLALEAQLYLTVPLLLLLARKHRPLVAVGVALVTSLAFRCAIAWWAKGGWGVEATGMLGYALMHSLPSRWFEFALGMGAAFILAQGHSRLPGLAATVAGFGALAFAGWLIQSSGEFNPAVDPLLGLGFFLLLIAGGSANDHWWRQMLNHPALTAAGTFSFSIYLIHQPLLRFLCWQFQSLAVSPLHRFWLNILLVLPLCLAVSALFYRWIELPSHRMAKRIIAARRPTRPPVVLPAATVSLCHPAAHPDNGIA